MGLRERRPYADISINPDRGAGILGSSSRYMEENQVRNEKERSGVREGMTWERVSRALRYSRKKTGE